MGSNEIGKKIGEIIGILRSEHNETQQELADSICVKRETVGQWESGTRQIKAEAIIKLAKHFKVSTDYILGISEVPTDNVELGTVCKYTGLSKDTVEHLHVFSDFAPISTFHERLIGDILLIDNIANKTIAALSNSSLAKAMAHTSKQKSEVQSEISNIMNTINGNDGFSISSQEAAEYYLKKANEIVTSHISDILEEMRDELVEVRIANFGDLPIEDYEWHIVPIGEVGVDNGEYTEN